MSKLFNFFLVMWCLFQQQQYQFGFLLCLTIHDEAGVGNFTNLQKCLSTEKVYSVYVMIRIYSRIQTCTICISLESLINEAFIWSTHCAFFGLKIMVHCWITCFYNIMCDVSYAILWSYRRHVLKKPLIKTNKK